jgi:hypothetical protein
MMINVNVFGVCAAGLAGKAGSRHAAHAAVAALAAPRKRSFAAATDASVDRGSP